MVVFRSLQEATEKMEPLPLVEKNELTRALVDMKWEVAMDICRTKPHLVNTRDSDEFTPLFHAMYYTTPPEELVMTLTEHASKECIERLVDDYDGGSATFIHVLAMTPYTEAMRLALEKSNCVNEKTSSGHTPLHFCLRTVSSLEKQKEMATILMMYGASCFIKNNSGYTPIDLMENRQGKEELVALLLALEKLVPAEFIARGENAVKAFRSDLQNGEITVVNCRCMFLGKEGVGKTSCIKAIFGEVFDNTEPSTDGIVTKTVFQTIGDDCTKWEHKEVDECEQIKQIRDEAIAENIAKKLKEPGNQQISNASDQEKALSSEQPNPHQVEQETATHGTKKPFQKLKRFFRGRDEHSQGEVPTNYKTAEVTTNHQTKEIPMTFDMRKKIADKLAKKQSSSKDSTSFWDYAGQPTYYITHRVFLTDGTAYTVTFSLLDKLDELAMPRDSQKGPFEFTNLESLTFWVRSIYEYSILGKGARIRRLLNGKIASPPIILVATHKDELKGTEEEKQKQIDAICTRILDEIKNMPYELHVDRVIHVVDNTNPMDKGIQQLKKTIGSYMKAMEKTVPISYVDFQSQVQELGKTTMRMSLDEIIKIAVGCGIPEENVMHVVNYLNDVGVVLYSPKNKKLEQTVVINIHMLIKIFMKVITVVKPDDPQECVSVMVQHLRKLDEEGLLHEELLLFLWRDELAHVQNKDVVFEECVELMKTFGLIFEMEHQEVGRMFIIPSRITNKTNDLEVTMDNEQTVSVYVTPKEFLPDAVYHVMVVKLLDYQDKSCSGKHKLFQNQAEVTLDHMHYVKLGTIQIGNKRSLKLEITSMDALDENGKSKPQMKPQPTACKEVLNVLQQNLDDLFPSKLSRYSLNILCPVCSTSNKQPHFQDLIVCLNVDNISCGRMTMPTTKIRSLFQKETPYPTHNEKQPLTGRTKKPSKKELHEFRKFLSRFSGNYSGLKCLWLRCLLYDHLTISQMESHLTTMQFFNVLCERGVISYTDVEILCEIAQLTEIKSAMQCVTKYKDQHDCSGDSKLTSYRKQLFKALNQASQEDFFKVVGYYNLDDLAFNNIWDVVFHLEKQKKLSNSEVDVKQFATNLNRSAEHILLDGILF